MYGASLADLMSKRRPGVVVFVGDSDERFRRRVFTLDEKGCFTCEGLPPGPVRLGLVRFVRKNKRYAVEDPRVYDLGKFQVTLEKPTELELKLPKSLPDR